MINSLNSMTLWLSYDAELIVLPVSICMFSMSMFGSVKRTVRLHFQLNIYVRNTYKYIYTLNVLLKWTFYVS